jgi:hypothetical protein
MSNRVSANQDHFLLFKGQLSCTPHPIDVLSKRESVSFPQKWSVGKEDVDLVGKNETVKRAVFA